MQSPIHHAVQVLQSPPRRRQAVPAQPVMVAATHRPSTVGSRGRASRSRDLQVLQEAGSTQRSLGPPGVASASLPSLPKPHPAVRPRTTGSRPRRSSSGSRASPSDLVVDHPGMHVTVESLVQASNARSATLQSHLADIVSRAEEAAEAAVAYRYVQCADEEELKDLVRDVPAAGDASTLRAAVTPALLSAHVASVDSALADSQERRAASRQHLGEVAKDLRRLNRRHGTPSSRHRPQVVPASMPTPDKGAHQPPATGAGGGEEGGARTGSPSEAEGGGRDLGSPLSGKLRSFQVLLDAHGSTGQRRSRQGRQLDSTAAHSWFAGPQGSRGGGMGAPTSTVWAKEEGEGASSSHSSASDSPRSDSGESEDAMERRMHETQQAAAATQQALQAQGSMQLSSSAAAKAVAARLTAAASSRAGLASRAAAAGHMAKMREELQEARTSLRTHTLQVESLMEDREKLRDKVAAEAHGRAVVEQTLSRAKRRTVEAETQLDEALGKLVELRTKLGAATASETVFRHREARASRSRKELVEECQTLELRVTYLEGELRGARTGVEVAEGATAAAKEDQAAARQEAELTAQEMNIHRLTTDLRTDELQRKIDALHTALGGRHDRLAALVHMLVLEVSVKCSGATREAVAAAFTPAEAKRRLQQLDGGAPPPPAYRDGMFTLPGAEGGTRVSFARARIQRDKWVLSLLAEHRKKVSSLSETLHQAERGKLSLEGERDAAKAEAATMKERLSILSAAAMASLTKAERVEALRVDPAQLRARAAAQRSALTLSQQLEKAQEALRHAQSQARWAAAQAQGDLLRALSEAEEAGTIAADKGEAASLLEQELQDERALHLALQESHVVLKRRTTASEARLVALARRCARMGMDVSFLMGEYGLSTSDMGAAGRTHRAESVEKGQLELPQALQVQAEVQGPGRAASSPQGSTSPGMAHTAKTAGIKEFPASLPPNQVSFMAPGVAAVGGTELLEERCTPSTPLSPAVADSLPHPTSAHPDQSELSDTNLHADSPRSDGGGVGGDLQSTSGRSPARRRRRRRGSSAGRNPTAKTAPDTQDTVSVGVQCSLGKVESARSEGVKPPQQSLPEPSPVEGEGPAASAVTGQPRELQLQATLSEFQAENKRLRSAARELRLALIQSSAEPVPSAMLPPVAAELLAAIVRDETEGSLVSTPHSTARPAIAEQEAKRMSSEAAPIFPAEDRAGGDPSHGTADVAAQEALWASQGPTTPNSSRRVHFPDSQAWGREGSPSPPRAWGHESAGRPQSTPVPRDLLAQRRALAIRVKQLEGKVAHLTHRLRDRAVEGERSTSTGMATSSLPTGSGQDSSGRMSTPPNRGILQRDGSGDEWAAIGQAGGLFATPARDGTADEDGMAPTPVFRARVTVPPVGDATSPQAASTTSPPRHRHDVATHAQSYSWGGDPASGTPARQPSERPQSTASPAVSGGEGFLMHTAHMHSSALIREAVVRLSAAVPSTPQLLMLLQGVIRDLEAAGRGEPGLLASRVLPVGGPLPHLHGLVPTGDTAVYVSPALRLRLACDALEAALLGPQQRDAAPSELVEVGSRAATAPYRAARHTVQRLGLLSPAEGRRSHSTAAMGSMEITGWGGRGGHSPTMLNGGAGISPKFRAPTPSEALVISGFPFPSWDTWAPASPTASPVRQQEVLGEWAADGPGHGVPSLAADGGQLALHGRGESRQLRRPGRGAGGALSLPRRSRSGVRPLPPLQGVSVGPQQAPNPVLGSLSSQIPAAPSESRPEAPLPSESHHSRSETPPETTQARAAMARLMQVGHGPPTSLLQALERAPASLTAPPAGLLAEAGVGRR